MKNKKPIILLDVDETVVNNVLDWEDWYRQKTGCELDFSFRNSKTISDIVLHYDLDPLDYWRQPNLYDSKTPIKEAVRVVNKYKQIFQFIFVSNCISEHSSSKKLFLKRHFGDIPFVDTYHKEFVMCDIAIDDRAHYLRNIKEVNPDVQAVQIITDFNNFHAEFKYLDWGGIDTFLSNFLVEYNKSK